MGQINLNNFKVITDKLNTFFVDNKFMVASEIPTEGEFKVGDIIINNGSTNVDEPMWICVEAGNPGTWTVFNSGGGSGGRLSTARNRVVLDGESKSEVSVGVSGFNKASDVLMVFINSRFMTEGVDYEINDDSTKIVAIEGAWNEELSSEFEIEMIVFKIMGEEGVVSSVNEIVKLKNTVVVNEAVNEVEIGIEGFNEGDDLTVYRNSVYMIEGIDYEVQGSKIVSLKGNWNAEGGSDYKFTFEVLKTVAKVNPDAVVGMEHLTEDVKEAIEAAGNIDLSGYATKEDLENIDMSGKQDKVDNSLTTNDKSIVGAINELFQSANNGKELIANAIGEPLSSEDTFSAMSDDINGLLSTFKTNMMNNGITVESSDKFKSLIDKIATMVEEGSGKGIQYASGNSSSTSKCEASLNFKPILVLVQTGEGMIIYLESYSTNSVVYAFYDSYVQISTLASIGGYVNETGFLFGQISGASWFNWYAIGVGEEDTTLRDSLVSILQEEGVNVTEEDDMASLISKVDSEFENKNNELEENKGFNISSATTLPSTGKENDICVITNNPVNNFEITCNLNDIDSDSSKIKLYLGTKSSTDGLLGTLISDVKNNVTINYHFNKVYQGNTRLSSFYFKDNSWKPFTVSCVELIKDGIQNATSIAGELSLGGYWQQNSGYVQDTGARYNYNTTGFQTKIDFTPFTKLVVRAKTNSSSRNLMIYATPTNYTVSSLTNSNSITYNYIASQQFNTTLSSKEYDITSWTGEHYLTLSLSTSDYPFLLYDMLLY